ncbi:class I SAM-dependent DNA methyltransferase [Poseidonibacter lekithochrous]|uniref:class I SAM-dependent DNA methyltransferase n=1 Tax=Poseidonibacter lekithochrous TaxID=1904463 RepID=UPI000D36497C|nr:N-6 DNA methylase [Poseidonibacter lekithochrous]
MLQTNSKLKSHIVSLWNTFWGAGLSNPITAIEQISYFLFIRQLDELEKKLSSSKFDGEYLPYIDEKEYLIKDEYGEDEKQKILKEKKEASNPRSKQELRWSSFKKLPPKKMLIHIKYNVFPFLKTLNDDGSLFNKYMQDAVFVLEKPNILEEAIKKIDEIFIEMEKDAKENGYAFQDIQGDVYEMLLGEIAQAGKNGQFRTPRHIITLISELLEPQLGDKIADPACGTSGFLLGAYQYILSDLIKEKNPSMLREDDDGFIRGHNSTILSQTQKLQLKNSFYGFDIDITMVRLGLMNLMMHGIDNPQIQYQDTLSKSYDEDNLYDIILANPPFTGKLDKDDIDPKLNIDSNSSELLFLLRISNMLKKDGKAGVIIPEGVLFSSSKSNIQTREILLKDNILEAVISLPSGVFKPYTGVKTSILIFTKVKDNCPDWNTDKVWFYELNNDGYTLDDNRRKIKDNPLPPTKELFRNRSNLEYKDRKSYFFVELSEIIDNKLDLSYNRYKEYEYDEQTYEPPKEILSKLISLEKEILSDLDELNGLI